MCYFKRKKCIEIDDSCFQKMKSSSLQRLISAYLNFYHCTDTLYHSTSDDELLNLLSSRKMC